MSRGSSTPGWHDRGWAQLNWERNESVHEVIPFTSFTEKIRSFKQHVHDRHNTSSLPVHVDLKSAWLWTLTPVFQHLLSHSRLVFWWFLVDCCPLLANLPCCSVSAGTFISVMPSCAARRRRNSSSSTCSLSTPSTTSASPVSSPPLVSPPSAARSVTSLQQLSSLLNRNLSPDYQTSIRTQDTEHSSTFLETVTHINFIWEDSCTENKCHTCSLWTPGDNKGLDVVNKTGWFNIVFLWDLLWCFPSSWNPCTAFIELLLEIMNGLWMPYSVTSQTVLRPLISTNPL